METKQITKIYAADTVHLYRLTNMEHSSKRYGRCEVCGEYVSEVYLQTHYVQDCVDGRTMWRQVDGEQQFGHEECLKSGRTVGKTHELKSLTLGGNTWIVGQEVGGGR